MTRLFLCILLAIPLAATGQIYKSVDENGNTVYSDTPPAGGAKSEQVRIGNTNSSPPPPEIPLPTPAVVEEKKVEASVEITSPVTDTTIAIGYAGNFSVEAAVKPALAAGWMAQLIMDGEAMGEPQAGTHWALQHIYRGSHSLSVVLTDSGGNILATSSPITVHVLRTMVGH